MKYDGGRRVFAAALLVCFGLLAFLYARRSVDAQISIDRRYPRVNQALTLSVDGDDVIAIGGEGRLCASDMRGLLRYANMEDDDVRDVIVGDGISEIDIDTFNGFDNLQSLKLGASVTRIAPGALKGCPKLKYLYYPARLEDVPLDFLYDCRNCVVITGGDAADLPSFPNVNKKKQVLERVDSLETLTEASGDAKLPAGVCAWWPTAPD